MRDEGKEKYAGYLVETKTGQKGRTYHSRSLIKGKVPVYLEIEKFIYSNKAILCIPETLKIIGFID
jgi:hypothetical protein